MNAGNVAAWACGVVHPQLGDRVPCLRSRFHAGDHRGQYGESLKAWSDPSLAELEAEPLTLLPPVELDETTEEWLEASGRGGVWLIVDDLTRVALLVLAVLAVSAAPALLVLLYRQV